MKVSVVIPAYNCAATIRPAIESCLAQTVTPHEIIIVDDASTDDTFDIVSAINGVILLKQNINKGPSAARNRGWDYATGDIIAFLDADDMWHVEKLRIITTFFDRDKSIIYLGHNYVINSFRALLSGIEPVEKTYSSILFKNPYQPSCICLKKHLDLRFNEQYRYCEDHELSIRVAYQYQCHWLDMPLTMLGRPQLTKGGASGNRWKMRKGELKLYSSIYHHKAIYGVFIPFLWVYSLAKMGYKFLRK